MSDNNSLSPENWVADQLRLVGKELIRRADNTDFSGWDMLQDILITITIPTRKEYSELMNIKMTFSFMNKEEIDKMIERLEIGG